VIGGPGQDRLLGGPGNDVLNAVDNQADTRINCGPGRDVARIDRFIDPDPVNCEVVIRRR
jgi:hypothetical protein